jgi:hypothetical protein
MRDLTASDEAERSDAVGASPVALRPGGVRRR